MSVADMSMLPWMCGHTRKNRLKNEIIRQKVRVAPIKDKMQESRLRWFGHVRRRPNDAPVRRLEGWREQTKIRGRGRPKQTGIRGIRTNMRLLGLDEIMALKRAKWKTRIRVDE
ncbi:unnamed protein product [Cuscuta epithymum]|uniref:Uncharacterized protein n=1 Tax=Cuscuta epithymum TaxID=186058 RepID=A0AAV0D8B6_9ASTE|nr:unnamed protein product [Cuscuta epithymum]